MATGLIEFYSAQANAALAKYDNILHLLGPTTDYTAPGTACEELIRELVRDVLPSRFSVDKGFIHGRREVDGQSVHSPEIDVLIHDSHTYAPLFRMGDFVIVQPSAVRGVIQVKRTMTSDKLRKGLENIVEAKRHIRDCRPPGSPASHQIEDVFSAFITFQDDIPDRQDGSASETYDNRIRGCIQEFTDGYTAPTFVGSLTRRLFGFNGLNIRQMSYTCYPSQHQGKNTGLQVFLALLTRSVLPMGMRPPFSFPSDYVNESHIVTYEAEPTSEPEFGCNTSVESAKPESAGTDTAE